MNAKAIKSAEASDSVTLTDVGKCHYRTSAVFYSLMKVLLMDMDKLWLESARLPIMWQSDKPLA